jgi:EmrB/QacA subfamily drug resistance transporter
MSAIEQTESGTTAARAVSRNTTLLVVCLAQFITVLDFQSITIALPSIQSALALSQSTLQWVISAQSLAFGGLLLLTGRTTNMVGRRRSFVIGLALFGIGALVCALAFNAAVLIAGRVIQGIAAAIITPAALSLLSAAFAEGRERAFAIGMWGAVAPVGGSVGIVLGGWLIGQFGWPWIFWLILPIVAVALGLSRLLEGGDRASMERLDVAGALVGTFAITLLVYGLSEMQRAGIAALTTLASVGLAGVLLVVFVQIERRVRQPLLPLGIFRNRTLAGANLLTIVHAATTNTPFFFLTLYLQQINGYTPFFTGLALLPANLAIVVGSSLGSALTTRQGLRRTLVIGMAVIVGSLLLLMRLALGSSYLLGLLPGLSLLGLGLGIVGVAVNVGGVEQVEREEHGLAWGLINTSARVGTALGLALLVTIAAARTAAFAPGSEVADAAALAGYQAAFGAAALLALIGGLAAVVLFRQDISRQAGSRSPAR